MIRVMLAIVVACSVSAACAKESATPPSQPGGSAASTPAPSASAAPPSEPARPAATAFREVTVPAGTSLRVRLTSGIASDTSKVEDPVSGTVAVAVTAPGEMAIPAGSRITGSVLDANGSGRVKGRASLAFRFDQLVVRGERYQIETERITRQAAADTKGDLKKGGLGAGAGAIVGGIAGGGKGAAIGSVIGGTGTVVATKGKEVRLAAGDTVTTQLREPLKILVPENK